MCAKCGCGCKSGKPEKNCKCSCPTCKGAKKSKNSEMEEYEEDEVEKSAFFASNVEKAFNLMGSMNAIKGAAGSLKSSFQSGQKFGRAGIKNPVSPYGKNKMKTGGFRAGNMAGRAGKLVSENPGKTALLAGGAAGAAYSGKKAIKKSNNSSAFGVEH